MTILRSFPILGLLLVVGCGDGLGPDNPPIDLRTDRSVYALGDEGTLTLANRHTSRIGHGEFLCPLLLERRTEDGWEVVPWPWEMVCRLILLHLPPGKDYATDIRILEEIYEPGGEYRFLTNVEDLTTGRLWVKHSRPFRVVDEGG